MFSVRALEKTEFPPLINEIPDPPEKLHVRGTMLPDDHKYLTVVGSRKYSDYGKQVVNTLIEGLRGYPISIISGLALGIDALAHEAALRVNLHTLSVPGSGIDDSVIYPRRHRGLAKRILESGGGLLSEFEPKFTATPWSFPQRNRIMAGLSHAVLVIEATKRSGSLITSRLATDYNRDVLTVPGSIYAESAKGPHMLLRLGAIPVTSAKDILEALGFDTLKAEEEHDKSGTVDEPSKEVLSLLREPMERDQLIRMLDMEAPEANAFLMELEINGHITSIGSRVMKSS